MTEPETDGFTPDLIITGSNSEIRQSLALIKTFEGLIKSLGIEPSSNARPIPNYANNKCLVTLKFKGIITGKTIEHYVESSFRWVKVDAKTVTLDQIKTLATTIKSKFDNLTFTTGRSAYCYNSIDQGFNRSWGYFNSLSDAQRLFEQMLDLQGFSPEWERLSCSTLPVPGSRFNDPPEKVQQAGILIRSERERPIAVMKFYNAVIKFPHYPKQITLVDRNLQTIQKLPFTQDD